MYMKFTLYNVLEVYIISILYNIDTLYNVHKVYIVSTLYNVDTMHNEDTVYTFIKLIVVLTLQLSDTEKSRCHTISLNPKQAGGGRRLAPPCSFFVLAFSCTRRKKVQSVKKI